MIDIQRIRQWLSSRDGMLTAALALAMAWLMYRSGLLGVWVESEEYGHGLMVLGVLAYLVYRRWGGYRPEHPRPWLGLALAVLAMTLAVVGETAGISVLAYYGIWFFAVAAAFAVGGFGLFKKLLVPLLIVLLLFPLPNPLGPMLTSELQLISSKLGVWLIRMFGGSVYLEGNVLDMGSTQLLVAEACAGLRYLFPLMSLGAIAGYMLHVPLWMKWAVFLATVPITIFMNSFRIAVTGILVANGGAAHTEGFLHFFEGWVVFIAASLLLAGVAWLLLRLRPGSRSLIDALLAGPDTVRPAKISHDSPAGSGGMPKRALGATLALILLAAVLPALLDRHDQPMPARKTLDGFPSSIGEWVSRVDRLPSIVEEVAGASEYFYGDFHLPSGEVVNTYVSYYESQRHGQIPHSPKVCIPGGGWVIESLEPVLIRSRAGKSFEANRLVTANGGQRVVSYYWLKQGPRIYRQEMLARLDLIRFALMENRTDGALVRLVTELRQGEPLKAADARLGRFASEFSDVLPDYVPD